MCSFVKLRVLSFDLSFHTWNFRTLVQLVFDYFSSLFLFFILFLFLLFTLGFAFWLISLACRFFLIFLILVRSNFKYWFVCAFPYLNSLR